MITEVQKEYADGVSIIVRCVDDFVWVIRAVGDSGRLF